MKLLIRILINAIAIWLTSVLLPNFELAGGTVGLIIVAIIFGVVNAVIRPIVRLLTLPISCLTLGLFTLVINALMVMITAWISGSLSLEGGFFEKFLIAFVAAIIISIVSTILNWILVDDND
jgi:putative membrane protein